MDKAGNVIGERPGAAAAAGHRPRGPPRHGVPRGHGRPRPAGGDASCSAPGIADDGRGLARAARRGPGARRTGNVQTPGTIIFVADVGEEGLSDLRGVKQLFNDTLKGQVDAFVSIDGTRARHHQRRASAATATASRSAGRAATASARSGWSTRCTPSGRAVARIAAFEVPAQPKRHVQRGPHRRRHVGELHRLRGVVRNRHAVVGRGRPWRSIDASFQDAVDQAVREENARWANGRLTVAKDLVGDRPGGPTRRESRPSCGRAHRGEPGAGAARAELGEGSTDSNIPMSLGIPAITVGGGGRAHRRPLARRRPSTRTDSWKGTQRVLRSRWPSRAELGRMQMAMRQNANVNAKCRCRMQNVTCD